MSECWIGRDLNNDVILFSDRGKMSGWIEKQFDALEELYGWKNVFQYEYDELFEIAVGGEFKHKTVVTAYLTTIN